jgi:hypothetical protein
VLLALAIAVSSVMLGAGLSFVPSASQALLGYMRTFATLAALAVVVTHLLPEALSALGPGSILVFLVGWFAPALAHFIGQRSTRGQTAHAVLEAGYWGLVVHHLADGVGLGTYARLPAKDGSHLDVLLALAAHTVPLIAVVSLAYRTTFGARSALSRALGLAFASVCGIALSSFVPPSTIQIWSPLIAALAGGLLLHVVTHDLTADAPVGAVSRALDLLVAAAGALVSLIGLDRATDPATWAFARRLSDFTIRTAPVTLVGLFLAALCLRRPERAGGVWAALAPAGALGPESTLLGLSLFGFASSSLRLLLTAGVLWLSPGAPTKKIDPEHPPLGFRERFSQALARSGPWLVVGLIASALLGSTSTLALDPEHAGKSFELLALSALANLTRVPAPAAVLIASGLLALGFSSGAALSFATLAPLLAGRTWTLQRRLIVSALSAAACYLYDQASLHSQPLDASLPRNILLAVLLSVLIVVGVWQRGVRVWLSSIVPPPAHEHEHAHDVHGPH